MHETDFINELMAGKLKGTTQFPDKRVAENFVDDMFRFLFIQPQDEQHNSLVLQQWGALKNTFASLLSFALKNKEEIENYTAYYFEKIPLLYQSLLKDARAIMDFDPAAQNMAEILVAYPGFYATTVFRLSHPLWQKGLRVLARLFTEFAHSKTGIDIHPGAEIGEAFAIDHGTGIVIGETAVIGTHVKIYQGVTLGALHVEKLLASTKRHPTIEDEVVIYAGATILGGETVIGKGSIIGGNVWITSSVPSNSVVYHLSEIKIKDKNPFPEPLNFVI